MDTNLQHKILLNQYRSLLTILHERGISYETPADAEVEKLSDPDLGSLVRSMSFLARTPGGQR